MLTDALDKCISCELQRIKVELKKSDSRIKANAVSKLTYVSLDFKRLLVPEVIGSVSSNNVSA